MLKVGEIVERSKKILEIKEAIKGVGTYQFNENLRYINSTLTHTATGSKVSFNIAEVSKVEKYASQPGCSIDVKNGSIIFWKDYINVGIF